MKQAYFYIDVPQDLIDVVNRIDYGRVSPERAKVFLVELNTLADKYNLPKRAKANATRPVTVHENVPDEAILAINQRDYTRIPAIAVKMAKPVIIKRLKEMGLLRNA
jgi:hypothetical protein